jgi:hypothetical protein
MSQANENRLRMRLLSSMSIANFVIATSK